MFKTSSFFKAQHNLACSVPECSPAATGLITRAYGPHNFQMETVVSEAQMRTRN